MRLFQILCSILFLLLVGCGKNTVQLSYPVYDELQIPSAKAQEVCVVVFSDDRHQESIGLRSDGSHYYPESDIPIWFAHVLSGAIAEKGYAVTIANSMEEARKHPDAIIITGTIDKVWVIEKSLISYSCDIKVTIRAEHNKKTLLNNTFGTSLSKPTITGSAPDVLSECARDVSRTIAAALVKKQR